MTRSKVSPDGRIAERDVAAKLVIIMVGLPARGKSYITKKLQRYLAWLQHSARIFNVGNRRRSVVRMSSPAKTFARPAKVDAPTQAASILLNGRAPPPSIEEPTAFDLNCLGAAPALIGNARGPMDQDAKFFDPKNTPASKLREQVALETLNELLDWLLHQGGAVGILDATNSTIERRERLVKEIRDKEPKLGILFIESICHDQNAS